MRFKLLLILLFSIVNLYAQNQEILIELKPEGAIDSIDFSCVKVIDARNDKSNIGFVTRGFKHNDTKLNFTDSFQEHFTNTLNKLLPKRENEPELILIIRSFIVSEYIGTMTQYGYCNLEIEFAIEIESKLYSFGAVHSTISEKSNNIKYSHDQRIIASIKDCIKKFNNSKLKRNELSLIESINQDSIFNYKNLPKKGVYLNYDQLIRRSPIEIDIDISLKKDAKNYDVYFVDYKNQINPELVQFVSDGINLYLNLNKSDFIKAENYGKYIYFQGKVPISTNIDQPIYLIGFYGGGAGAFIGGLVGGLILSASTNGQTQTTNTSLKGVVLDTDNGTIRFLTDRCLFEITKPYPEILKAYRGTKRKLEDKKNVVFQLNSKF